MTVPETGPVDRQRRRPLPSGVHRPLPQGHYPGPLLSLLWTSTGTGSPTSVGSRRGPLIYHGGRHGHKTRLSSRVGVEVSSSSSAVWSCWSPGDPRTSSLILEPGQVGSCLAGTVREGRGTRDRGTPFRPSDSLSDLRSVPSLPSPLLDRPPPPEWSHLVLEWGREGHVHHLLRRPLAELVVRLLPVRVRFRRAQALRLGAHLLRLHVLQVLLPPVVRWVFDVLCGVTTRVVGVVRGTEGAVCGLPFGKVRDDTGTPNALLPSSFVRPGATPRRPTLTSDPRPYGPRVQSQGGLGGRGG